VHLYLSCFSCRRKIMQELSASPCCDWVPVHEIALPSLRCFFSVAAPPFHRPLQSVIPQALNFPAHIDDNDIVKPDVTARDSPGHTEAKASYLAEDCQRPRRPKELLTYRQSLHVAIRMYPLLLERGWRQEAKERASIKVLYTNREEQSHPSSRS
jgi:hypothetical protein